MSLRLSPKAARLLVREPRLDSSERLRVLIDKNVNDICNVVRKPGSKKANPDTTYAKIEIPPQGTVH